MGYKEEIKKLEKYYGQELKRKNKIIEDLKKENLLILGSALKRSETLTVMEEKMKKLMEDNKMSEIFKKISEHAQKPKVFDKLRKKLNKK